MSDTATVDTPNLLPGLDRYARPATHLNPYPSGTGEPAAPDDTDPRTTPPASHLGGPLHWPAGEPWPRCAEPHVIRTEHRLPDALAARFVAAKMRMQRDWRPGTPMPADTEYDTAIRDLAATFDGFIGVKQTPAGMRAVTSTLHPEPGGNALVAVAELAAHDIPTLNGPGLLGPDGADLLQVLWCPNEHYLDEDYAGPAVALHWRHADDLPSTFLVDPPAPTAVVAGLVPKPCALRPRPVTEYPAWPDVSDPALAERLREKGSSAPVPASTWKIGGWPAWPTTGRRLKCGTCGGPTALLLQLNAGEPTGITFERHRELRIFTCEHCPSAPPRLDLQ